MSTALKGLQTRITCTRKTTPGLARSRKVCRSLRRRIEPPFRPRGRDSDQGQPPCGGWFDCRGGCQGPPAAGHTVKVELEVDTLEQLELGLAAGIDIVLLDNMDVATLREAVRVVDGRAVTEASGGVTLDSVRAIAETGVDLVSVGAITHSAPYLDIGLDF